jgi:hypothetical protein
MTGLGKINLTESETDWTFTMFLEIHKYHIATSTKYLFDFHFFADTQNCGMDNFPQRISNGLADQIWPWMASIGFYSGE